MTSAANDIILPVTPATRKGTARLRDIAMVQDPCSWSPVIVNLVARPHCTVPADWVHYYVISPTLETPKSNLREPRLPKGPESMTRRWLYSGTGSSTEVREALM